MPTVVIKLPTYLIQYEHEKHDPLKTDLCCTFIFFFFFTNKFSNKNCSKTTLLLKVFKHIFFYI